MPPTAQQEYHHTDATDTDDKRAIMEMALQFATEAKLIAVHIETNIKNATTFARADYPYNLKIAQKAAANYSA